MPNRKLYTDEAVRRVFGKLRSEMQELGAKHLGEVVRLRARIIALEHEIDELRTSLRALRAARAAIVGAQAELVSLHRERSIQRAQASERDPFQPLN